MTTTLQTAGEYMEALAGARDLIAAQAVEIERKNALLRDVIHWHRFDLLDELLAAIQKELAP